MDNTRNGTPKHLLAMWRATRWLCSPSILRRFDKIRATYQAGGLGLCFHMARTKFMPGNLQYRPGQYQLSAERSARVLGVCSFRPLISVVVPVHKVRPEWLDACIRSVIDQHYCEWELILVDDASQNADLTRLMLDWASRDQRVSLYVLERNSGIAVATNYGIQKARGQFIGFLDHDDELTPDALTWVVRTMNDRPEALWFYSDEDKIDEKGRHYEPYFKPDYSPEHLLSIMFTCHFSVYSKALLDRAGGLRLGFDGAQDHELSLRLSELVDKTAVVHIPRVLYHWRAIPGSAASGAEGKPHASSAGRRAVAEALARRGIKGNVTSHHLYATVYQTGFQPSYFPKVSIVVPTRNSLDLLQACLTSLRARTTYPEYEVIVIDNCSDDPALLRYVHDEESSGRIRLLKYDKPFNHSEMNNMAIGAAAGDYVVMMNNDVEVICDRWLEQLVAVTELDSNIGVVGCMLLYPDKRVQHAGVIMGLCGSVGHSHKRVRSDAPGYFGRLHALQEYTGMTAAMCLIKKKAFLDVGGFDAEHYPTSYNDVDLCIRMRNAGYRCIYNPMVKAIHHESKTRPITAEEAAYRQRVAVDYRQYLENDPFYNPNLSLNNECFEGYRDFPPEAQLPELRTDTDA